MTFRATVPLRMLQDIETVLLVYSGRTVPIYAEAEKIRLAWLSENVALEDIVDEMLRKARSYSVSFEIDPAQAADALRGPS
jgi:hypothetical protein